MNRVSRRRFCCASPSKSDAHPISPALACVRRILKNALPSSTNVGKDASAAFARACGIFIIYITACANDFAREHKRQTITANDVLAAVKELDFDEFSSDITSFLESYRKNEKSKKDAKAKAVAEREAKIENAVESPSGNADDEDDDGAGETKEEEDTSTDHKRPKSPDEEDEENKESPDPKRLKFDEGEKTDTEEVMEAIAVAEAADESQEATAAAEEKSSGE